MLSDAGTGQDAVPGLELPACVSSAGYSSEILPDENQAEVSSLLPWPILLMESSLACRSLPPSLCAFSSKKKLVLLALSAKYWLEVFCCRHTQQWVAVPLDCSSLGS